MARIGTFEFVAPLWQHSSPDGWYFVTVPADISDDIAELGAAIRGGFGSIRVAVTVGGTSWRTSVFPDRNGTFVLPMKKAVRVAERLRDGDDVHTRLELVDL